MTMREHTIQYEQNVNRVSSYFRKLHYKIFNVHVNIETGNRKASNAPQQHYRIGAISISMITN